MGYIYESVLTTIQYLILESNIPFGNAENIVEDNPSPINAFEFMYDFDDIDFEYNESICGEAYETFKLQICQ